MKKTILIVLILVTNIYADANTIFDKSLMKINIFPLESTYEKNGTAMTIGDFGNLFEGTSGHISTLIMFFSLFISGLLALFSVIAYRKSNKIMKKIDENRTYIDEVYNKLNNTLKMDIKKEISSQIILNSQDVMSKVEEDAYRKIDISIKRIKDESQAKLFDYQQIVFKVNQAKKYAYEKVINNTKLSVDEKLQKSIAIQGSYNETNHHDLPNLFSTDIDKMVIPTAIKLSEFHELQGIMVKYLESLIEKSVCSYKHKSQIEDILREYYGWKGNG